MVCIGIFFLGLFTKKSDSKKTFKKFPCVNNSLVLCIERKKQCNARKIGVLIDGKILEFFNHGSLNSSHI